MKQVPTITALLTAFATSIAVGQEAQSPRVDFNRDIRPILSETCFQCHGPDHGQRKADLRLDTKAGLVSKEEGVVVPGKPGDSELFGRITSEDAGLKMPPAGSGRKLSPRQIELIRRWIEQGAQWKGHWAYLPPTRSPVPKASDATIVRNIVDRFVLARQGEQGLKPSPETDRVTLIRRLSFDLRGLPPTSEEVAHFVNDRGLDAYERLVDRFLNSPHYGERMAIYWLDVVRYADTNGIHGDNHREHAPYRDYVIDAFNTNMPFDEFTVEQLAGDLLDNPTNEQRIASGYNRLNMTTREGGAQPKEYRAKYAADRVRNASAVWMGATLGCAECHDHKFDPYTQKDFYSFAAFFADVQETAVGTQKPERILDDKQREQIAMLDRQIAELRKQKPLPKQQIDQLEKQKQQIQNTAPATLVAMAGNPRVTRILPRGNWLDDSGPVVQPATPDFLKPLPVNNPPVNGRRATRLDLARWVVARDNPLTARVFVNRLWKLYFGRGLASSLDDFGAQGAWPTHPALLDWLAVEFRDSGWDVKHIVRLLVTSATYLQSSQSTRRLRQLDPYNRWLARQGRFVMDAEMVRDNALAVSGLLVTKFGGRSVKPYQPGGYWAHLNFPKRRYQHDRGADQYRRGVYTYWCRTFLHPSMLAFNAPSREECTVDRPRSNTPLQALVLLNDPTYVEAARTFAERILREANGPPERRIQFAYRHALSRPAESRETQLLTSLYQKHLTQYRADRKAAAELLNVGDRPAPKNLDPAELAAWTSVARVILNLHETITRR